MDILKQCQKWHEENKQHKIIDALEAIPAEERTPEIDRSWPAPTTIWRPPESRREESCFKGPLDLMQSHEEELWEILLLEFPHGVFLLLSGSGRSRSAIF